MHELPPPHVWDPPESRPSRHVREALLLAVVAPTIAESVASSNTPGYVFPLVLPLLIVIYGLPVLLIRELWTRGRVGIPGAVTLAIAYGAFNEGLVAAQWFKLDGDGDVLAFTADQALRTNGVNVNLVVGLTLFHAIWSLLIPIVLVNGWSRSGAGRPWMPRWAWITSVVVIAFVALGSISDGSMARVCGADEVPGSVFDECVRGRRWTLGFIVVAVAFAFVLPKWRLRRAGVAAERSRRTLLWVGALSYVAFIVSFFVLPLNDLPELSLVMSGALIVVGAVVIARWGRGPGGAAIVLATGTLIPGMVGSLIRVVTLQPVIVVVFLVFVRSTWRRAGLTSR